MLDAPACSLVVWNSLRVLHGSLRRLDQMCHLRMRAVVGVFCTAIIGSGVPYPHLRRVIAGPGRGKGKMVGSDSSHRRLIRR